MVTRNQAKENVQLNFIHDIGGPVFVAGTFNGWDTRATPMKRRRGGAWQVVLKLSPGEHQFRYFAGGQWYTDYAANGVAPNGLGDFNSVVRVEAPKQKPQPAPAPATVKNASRKIAKKITSTKKTTAKKKALATD